MTTKSPTKQQQKEYNFTSNGNFESFNQFRLCSHEQRMIDLIYHPDDKTKKAKALIRGCIRRNDKCLYKGEKFYIEDLQAVLDQYPDIAPLIMKSMNIVLNKSQTKVCVQCHNCANFTEVWKFCPTCEHVHYCQEACEMQIKFTHEREQCRLRPFPKVYKALQVEIHVGSDLGYNVQLCFQH